MNNGKLSVQEYQDKINAILENGNYSQEFTTIFKLAFAEDDLQDEYNKAIAKFGKDNKDTLEKFFTDNSINTIDEIDYWNKVTEGAKTASEAVEMYTNVKGDTFNDKYPISLSISDTIDQLNTQLKPAFDSLKSAYQDIFTDDGFTLQNVDLSMLDSIKSTIDELNSLEDADINIDYDSFENLATVLTDSTSSAQDVHDAINTLATDLVSALNPALKECSGENYKLVQSLLESLGIVNSEEVMISNLGYSYDEYIAAKTEAANAGFDLADATEDEVSAFVNECIASGNCGEALALLQLKKMLVNTTVLSTTDDINNVLALAEAAGVTIDSLASLQRAKAAFDNAMQSGDMVGIAMAQAALAIESAKVKQEVLDFKPTQVDFSPANTGKSSGSAGKEAADAYLEAFEDELDELEALKDAGLISEKEYLDRLRILYQKYFKDKEEYVKEYAKYEKEYLEGMKALSDCRQSRCGR